MKTLEKSWVGQVADGYDQARQNFLSEVEGLQETKKVKIGGIPISVPIETHSSIKEEVKKEIMQSNALKDILQEKKLPFEGILPKAVFEKFVHMSPFYVFYDVDKDGKVQADVKNYMGDDRGVGMHMLFAFLLQVALYATLVMTIGRFANLLFLAQFFAYFFADKSWKKADYALLVLASLFLSSVYLFSWSYLSKKLREKNAKSLLWKDRTDRDFFIKDRVNIALPEPPKRVVERLSKWYIAGHRKLGLVVHEQAFEPYIDEKSMKKFVEIYDPISFYVDEKYPDMVVIVDQYGDIPAEKVLMDKFNQTYFKDVVAERFQFQLN